MSRIFSFMIVGGLVLFAMIAVNFHNINTRQESGFIQISVLARNKANYGIDDNLLTIPAVSMGIIEDVVHDIQGESSVPVIRYTSLPVQDPKTESPQDEGAESVQEIKHNNSHVHENNGHHGTNPPGGGNGNNHGNGNGNGGKHEKDKLEKDKEKEKNK